MKRARTYSYLSFVFTLVLTLCLSMMAEAGAPKPQVEKEGKMEKGSEQRSYTKDREQMGKESKVYSSEGTQRLGEVMVTATKRGLLSAQDVPFSLNVQSEEDLKRLNTTDIEDLSRNVAGLSIQNLGPGQSVVNVRGISSGQIVRDQPGVKEQVGIYLDETPVSLSLFTPDLDLFDVRRVETLRGPQGTLFGAGSIGGAVRYITNQPLLNIAESRSEVDLNTVDGGSTGGSFRTAFNVPLTDNAAARLVTYVTKYGGFIDAIRETGIEDKDVNDGSRYGGRLALLIQPVDNLSITPRVLYQNVDMNGFNRQEIFNLFANHFSEDTLVPGRIGERQQFLLSDEAFEDETLILDNVVDWSLDDLFRVSYSASYIKRDILVRRDSTALDASFILDYYVNDGEDLGVASGYLDDVTDMTQMTHELHFSSNNESALQWITGVFYSDIERDYGQLFIYPGIDAYTEMSVTFNEVVLRDVTYVSSLTYDISQVALFGEATYALSDSIALTSGLRWYRWEEERTFKAETNDADPSTGDDKTKSDGFSPRFIIRYDLSPQFTVNAQASKGFRLGGVNDPLNVVLCQGRDVETFGGFQDYEDETLWNYEVGFKSLFNDGSIGLNAAAFYTDIENLQVTLEAGTCSSRVSYNVPESHTLGAELELRAYLMDSLLLTFAGSYVEAEFDSTVQDANNNVLEGLRKGNRIPSVPDWQLSASATYTFPGLLRSGESYISASWQFVGEQITQPKDQEDVPFPAGELYTGITGGAFASDVDLREFLELDAYHLVNVSAGLMYDDLEFVLYVNNITDENAKLSVDRERGGSARLAYHVGQPRTFGVTARMAF